MTDQFTRDALRTSGFRGFVAFRALDLGDIPQSRGVYVVLREDDDPPAFLDSNPGGRFKGKDPTVASTVLESRWVVACPVVYIGKATNLRSRLRQYRDFGIGRPVGHWGGRYIWQVSGANDFRVCWRTTTGDPRAEEISLMSAFRAEHGCLPFANINS